MRSQRILTVPFTKTARSIMGSASKYWRLVRLDSTGNRRVEESPAAKAFFQERFPELVERLEVPDTLIQQELLQLSKEEAASESANRDLASRCLRCFISNQIEQGCIDLERRYGHQHGFTRYDLFALVLDDDGRRPFSSVTDADPGQYQSLAEQILRTFDPSRAGLSTWVTRMVKHHRELNAFLLEHGVYLVTDWAILNDTTPRQLERIFAEFPDRPLSELEIRRAAALLQSYHEVYRQDRLQQRQSGMRGQCPPPSRDQLLRIAVQFKQLLEADGTDQPLPDIAPERLLAQLQAIATRLRQHRIAVRGGKMLMESLDQPEMGAVAADLTAPETEDDDETRGAFLKAYRQQFLECLDRSLEQVMSDRLTTLQRRKPPVDQSYLLALKLFHCEGKSMSDIAPLVGLREQYQVTRLMKLKELRADVRQRLLVALRDRTRDLAKRYADPQQLEALDQEVNAALEAQLDPLFQQAEAETTTSRDRPLTSLFARRMCGYLDTRTQTSR